MAYGDFPFGLRKVLLKRGALVAELNVEQRFTFGDMLTTKFLEGRDAIQSVVSYGKAGEFEFEAGGINLAAYKVMTGRDATESGSAPNRITEMEAEAGDRFPYFEVYGQSLGENDDATYIYLPKCKLTEAPKGEFRYEEFFITSVKGLAISDGTRYYKIVSQETYEDVADLV